MAITKRREAQMQATRAAILQSALEIAREQGWPAVTIRRIAEMIDYSAPIIYEYFKNKEAVLAELQRQGFQELEERMRQASAGCEDAVQAVLSLGNAYMLFAEEQPELYQIMHGLSSSSVPLEATFENATGAGGVGEEVLRRWQNSAGFAQRDFDLTGAGETCWALLHGFASLGMLGRLEGEHERTRGLARAALADMLRAWSSIYGTQQ